MNIILGTRPDLCYTLSYFSKFQGTALYYSYLKQTRDQGLKYRPGEQQIEIFTNVDFTNEEDSKSVSIVLVKCYDDCVS